ncbi:hypothetical protein VULLAG_LOCUS11000 [Vulpes lagopus]
MDLGGTGFSDFRQPLILQDFAGGFLISAGFEPGGWRSWELPWILRMKLAQRK